MPDTIHVRGEGGMVIAMDLPLPEPIAERLEKGLLRRVNEDGTPYTGAAEPDVPTVPDKVPAKADPKPAWVGWAVANGADPETAEGLTKNDLIEQYGGTAE
jgi:hypothetical protein